MTEPHLRSASSVSLTGRALLAVFLTVGFYGLALAMSAFLLFLIYAEFVIIKRVNAQLTLVALVGAGTILWSILPRWDRFVAPGPRLDPKRYSELFAQVRAIARQVGQKMPADIYVVPDVNAFVSERGGVMGLGSRRIMGIGLPLLQALTVSQFRAVVAHEFGHFYGGDTKLSPWVYKTRLAIGRTIQGLGRSAIAIPFRWYGMQFLRITQSISRRQEFMADELAARVVGTQPLIQGLRAISGAAPAFQAYLRDEIVPAAQAGFCPPLAQGFTLFLSVPAIDDKVKKTIAREVATGETNPYDSHPSLPERIAALQALPPGSGEDDRRLALSLLTDESALERELLAGLFTLKSGRSLNEVEWERMGTVVWLPLWRRSIQPYADGLKGLTPAALLNLLSAPNGVLVAQLHRSAGKMLLPDQVKNGVVQITALALAVALADNGWTVEAWPGQPVCLRRGEETILPFVIVPALAGGKLTAEAWAQTCDQFGIANLDLSVLKGA